MISKWIELNPGESKAVVDDLYGRVRLERLDDNGRKETLLELEDCPPSISNQAKWLYMRKCRATTAKANISNLDPEAIFVHARDGICGRWTHISAGGCATALRVNEESQITLKFERR